jgi:hypothetical protein
MLSVVPGVTRESIARIFDPYVVEEFDADSPQWMKAIGDIDKTLARRAPNRWLTDDGVRTVENVQARYDEEWNRVELAGELLGTHASWFEWGERRLRARTVGYKRVVQLLLGSALEWLRPASVAEVGFGWGLNLLALSVQFPEIRFGGVELTHAGVRTALRLAGDAETPRLLEAFAVDRVCDSAALSRLDLRQGSADALPLADKSVDTIITVLALEQMERIREAALRELARVARHNVIMIEPFRDWNDDPRHRAYVRRLDYWAGGVEELREFGLVPLVADGDLPQKLTTRAGIVIARVETPGGRG